MRRDELTALLAPVFADDTVTGWIARLEAHDVLCAPVNRYADLLTDPQIAATGMLVEQEHPRAGRFRTLDAPVRLSLTPASIRTPAPALGEHTDTILREAGVSPSEIAELRRLGIVG